MNLYTPRRLLATVLSCAALALASGPTLAQEKSKLRVSIIPIVDVAPLFAAMKQGYFKEQGLEIDTSPVAGGAAGIPGLVGGAYDVVFTNVVSALAAKEQGINVKIIGPGSATSTSAPDFAGLLVRKGEGLKTGSDMNGKSIAVNTRNNIIWLYAREWAAQTGGDVSKINLREVPFPQMIDALKGKQVDAIFAVEPFLSAGRNDPALEVMAYPYLVTQPGMSVGQYIVTDEFLSKHPETVKRFSTALLKGVDWVNANLDQPAFHELVAGYTRMDAARVSQMTIGAAPKSVSEESINKTVQVMRKHDLIKTDVPAASILHDTAR